MTRIFQTGYWGNLHHLRFFEVRVGDTDALAVAGLDPDKEKLCLNHLCYRVGEGAYFIDSLTYRLDCVSPIEGR